MSTSKELKTRGYGAPKKIEGYATSKQSFWKSELTWQYVVLGIFLSVVIGYILNSLVLYAYDTGFVQIIGSGVANIIRGSLLLVAGLFFVFGMGCFLLAVCKVTLFVGKDIKKSCTDFIQDD